MANNLRLLRQQHGWTQAAAAAALGTTRNQYVKLEGGSRRLSDVWIDRAAKAYRVDASAVVRNGEPLVVGRVAEGGRVHWLPTVTDSDDQAVALLIEGGLGPLLTGGLLTFRPERRGVNPADHNRPAIVSISPDLTLIRRIIPAAKPDRFNLIASDQLPTFDAAIMWINRIEAFSFPPI